MSRRRKDVHSPANLITEDYEYAGATYFGALDEAKFLRSFKRWPWAESDHAGDCFHCGAKLKYYAILKHKPTHTIIRVGETCLDNRFALATEDFQRLRKAAKLERAQGRAEEIGEVWKAEHPEEVAFLGRYLVQRSQPGGRFSEFFSQLCESLAKHGALSDAQLEALHQRMERWGAIAC